MKKYKTSTMVDYSYDANVNTKLARRRRVKIALYSLIILGVLALVAVIVDGLRSQDTVVHQQPAPTSTLAQTIDRSVFDEKDFRFTADTSWREVPPIDDTFNSFRYQSTVNGLVRREMTVYVNSMPEEFPIPRVLPIEVEGNRVVPLGVSPECSEFQPDENNRRDITLSWAGVEFLCDPDSGLDMVGTSHNKMGYLTEINGKRDAHNKFFFVYLDLEPTPRLSVFNSLLETFEAK